MDAISLDFSRICRACKCKSDNMRQLFENSDNEPDSTRIDEMLMACASVQVNPEDGLPNMICLKCIEQLKYAFSFKVQCEKSDASLREYAKNLKTIETDEDLTNKLINDLENIFDQSKLETADSLAVASVEKCDFIEILDNRQMILTCRECYKIFTSLDGLRCHKRIHTGTLFKCKFCDKGYTRTNHLKRHELSHGRRKVYICKICNKTLTRYEHLKRHLVTHLKKKPFHCVKCNHGFTRAEHLIHHIEKCKGDRIHICDICNKAFNRADSLEVHRLCHDNKSPILLTLESIENVDEHYIELQNDVADLTQLDFADEDDDDDNDIGGELDDYFEPQVNIEENAISQVVQEEAKCQENEEGITKTEDICDEELDTKFSLEFADDARSDFSDGDSDYKPSKSINVKRGRGRPKKSGATTKNYPGKRGRSSTTVKVEIKEEDVDEEEGEHPCPICNEMFNKLSLLDKHATQHNGDKIFQCKVCNKSFYRSNHLKRHEASHSIDKPFTCEICTKGFNRKDHLHQHMKLHSRSQEYECDTCKKTFARADHLTKHKLSKHNQGERVIGEKKFKCTVCDKYFTTEKYRDIHKKAHNGEKKHQCKTCDKTFLSKSHLTEHMKFHNEKSKKFLCSECGQRFIRNDYLVIHMRRHRGEKPFKCKYCGKGFPRTTDLTVHERYHTGEKTHLCVICGRGFGRAYNLTVHMRTHTGERPYQCTYCDAAFAQGNDLKAHVRRHTGERFQCELCTESFLMGYLLTQHKRVVHGLNVVSNIRRLQPVSDMNPDDPQPITIALPTPVVPSAVLNAQLQMAMVNE